MRLLTFMFNTLLGCILFTGIFTILVIALYILKIALEEIFDEKGIERFIKWVKNFGASVLKKKEG